MKIFGYSERGMINSFFYEMKNGTQSGKDSLVLLNDFVSIISFPYSKPKFDIKDVSVLIEQSFSDFGDADAVLLIENNGINQTIFIEAKVKTATRNDWKIAEEYEEFVEGHGQRKVSSSNLFAQLYYKGRLFKTLKKEEKRCLEEGVAFSECFPKQLRKIGKNRIILKAVDSLVPYKEEAFFISLVPDSQKSVFDFYKSLPERKKIDFPELQDWDIGNWGFITWAEVEHYCQKWGMTETLSNFDFNRGQIYDKQI